MEWLSGWSAWLILGFALLILEIAIPGVFIVWWGFAAILVAGLVALIPVLPMAWQVTAFAVLAIVFSLLWWQYQHRKDVQADQSTELNARDHTMIGTQGAIIEILDNGIARGKFGDTTWRVVGEHLKLGDKVTVYKVEGITLFVKVAPH
ncbi:NfeD family protein [Muribacter muris]|uniref:NfeD family protein n=1 Tax=Muribacter muris TaxID=67855 RepID=A0A4Y9K5R0_9PAST|nr:NfeD family protein [Muribacter muris]MBF0784555.1 NfeD family protein [Muribacter muris]MBF0826149.1 NfeD family protein [Muribacter muris]TFV12067.1 NfeD family protein [Muribacter muris]